MSNLITFENMKFGKLTVIEKNGEFFFIGNEIAELLGYSNYRKAVMVHVDEEDKLRSQIGYAGQLREVTLINEQKSLKDGSQGMYFQVFVKMVDI